MAALAVLCSASPRASLPARQLLHRTFVTALNCVQLPLWRVSLPLQDPRVAQQLLHRQLLFLFLYAPPPRSSLASSNASVHPGDPKRGATAVLIRSRTKGARRDAPRAGCLGFAASESVRSCGGPALWLLSFHLILPILYSPRRMPAPNLNTAPPSPRRERLTSRSSKNSR